MNIHEKYLNRCIQLAKNGLGSTYPNPMVGSVIVHNNIIIGEGWHRKAGGPHAEVHAIQSVKETALLPESTIYVSLEPCSHFGKTPPCSDLIIEKGIKNVVVGTVDPFSEVAGRGIKKLLEAGHNVTVGVLEKECLELNKRFFTYHTKNRPYIILKWAQSADGFLAPETKDEQKPVWITNSFSRQLVHKWRSEEQAVLVGTHTVTQDNPSLTTRDWFGNHPVRVIIDRTLKLTETYQVFDDTSKTIIITETEKENSRNLYYERADFSKSLPEQIGIILYNHHLQSLIIEGGSKTLQAFIDAKLWDEAQIFTGTVMFKSGLKAPVINNSPDRQIEIKEDLLTIHKNYD